MDEPGWYTKGGIVRALGAGHDVLVVLRTPDFRGGGGDGSRIPHHRPFGAGWPGTWQSRPANFMVRAVAEEAPFPGHKDIAVYSLRRRALHRPGRSAEGVGTWNGGIANLRLDAQTDHLGLR